ncbi:hypothetical protein [Nocardia sp. CDC160]|uniref:hypothetical protein n=1 Tax=Nocardia sp. CDC160 TaxID=3112166 RepID=UPI002DB5AC75|nr:hypothetical protein [Nocardia sp. CDC160]MEC3914967.1 hypothetical protein [Nocardia sp. CDC160]
MAVLSGCGSDHSSSSTTVAAPQGGVTTSSVAAGKTSGAAPSSVQAGGTGDACTEVQYEIDMVHALQQGQEPGDPHAVELRLSSYREHAPTEVIANYSQLNAVIYGHLEHKGQDQINTPVVDALVGKLSAWKSSHC